MRNLDISWSNTLASQTGLLFESLAKNRQLQHLNIAMLALDRDQDITGFKKFIRRNQRLLHLNLTGLLRTREQVAKVVKAIKASETLLAVHLSHTPIITKSKQLQAYIRRKLGMNNAILRKPKNKFSTTQLLSTPLK